MTLQEKIAYKQLRIAIEVYNKVGEYSIKTYTAIKIVDGELVHKVFEVKFNSDDERAKQVARVRKLINRGTWTNVVFAAEVWTSEGGYGSASADPDRGQAIIICSEQRDKEPLLLVLGIDDEGLSDEPWKGPVISGELLIWPPKETIN